MKEKEEKALEDMMSRDSKDQSYSVEVDISQMIEHSIDSSVHYASDSSQKIESKLESSHLSALGLLNKSVLAEKKGSESEDEEKQIEHSLVKDKKKKEKKGNLSQIDKRMSLDFKQSKKSRVPERLEVEGSLSLVQSKNKQKSTHRHRVKKIEKREKTKLKVLSDGEEEPKQTDEGDIFAESKIFKTHDPQYKKSKRKIIQNYFTIKEKVMGLSEEEDQASPEENQEPGVEEQEERVVQIENQKSESQWEDERNVEEIKTKTTEKKVFMIGLDSEDKDSFSLRSLEEAKDTK